MSRNILGFLWITLAAVAVLPLASCKRKEAPAPPPPTVEKPRPDQAFSDPARQSRYADAWHRYFEQFDPPAAGTPVFVRLRDGRFAGGELVKLSDSLVVLRDGSKRQEIPREDIDPESLPDLYAVPFASRIAHAEVSGATGEASSTNRVGGTRYTLTDFLDAREGPGPRYRAVTDHGVDKGTTLVVLEERGGWIRVRPRRPDARSFWVNAFTTVATPDSQAEDFMPDIVALLRSGYLAGFSPEQNEALVPRPAWIGTDVAVREGISRMLAAQCTRQRGGGVDWVEVKDAENGRRLARYSQAQGFRQQ